MSASRIFTLCFCLYQAQGAPQYLNLAWFHPMSMMNMHIRPHPNADFFPALQEPLYPAQDPDIGSLVNQPTVDDDELFPDDEPGIAEFRRRQPQYPQQCDPRKLFQRSSCLNSTWVRTCSVGGNYRDLQCPQNFNCMTNLGFCVPQLTRRLQTFSCPDTAGTYPDPRNCMVYHRCPQGNETTPITQTCFWPQIYDPLTMSCQMETPERPCYKINCRGQQAVAYQGDPNIYANCSRSGTVQTLNRCAFGLGLIEQTQQCEPYYCMREGNIRANEIYQYYTCSRIFKRLIRSEIKTCSTDGSLNFNETLGVCAPPVSEVPIQARMPSQIVETLYHEVPNVTDLVRKVHEVSSPLIPPKAATTEMTENHQGYTPPSNLKHHLYSFGMPPMNIIREHAEHRPVLFSGMPFNNMMPFNK